MARAFRIFAALAVLIGFGWSPAHPQIPLTGAGRGTPGAGAAFSGPGDVVSGAIYWAGLRAYSLAQAGTKAANVCNAADANCADVNTLANGKFDVATAQGAPLNCGGAGGTCTIKTLYDQSGSANCSAAACDLSQATIANRPTLTFGCAGLGASLPCMTFNGTSQELLRSGGAAINQPMSMSLVANSTNNAAQQTAIRNLSDVRIGFANAGANTVFCYAGVVLSATATDGTWHAFQGVYNNAGSPQGDCNVNGTATTGSDGVNNAIGTSLSLGSGSGTEFFKGTITEGGSWAVAFSGAQSSNMSANQRGSNGWGF